MQEARLSSKQKKVVKLARRARGGLGANTRKAGRLARKKKLSGACKTTIETLVESLQVLLVGVG